MITTLRNHCFNFDVFVFEMIKQETYKTIWWWWNYIVIHITRDSKLERSFSVLILLTQSQVINENTTFHFHLELWNEFFMLKATKEVHILWNVRFSMHLASQHIFQPRTDVLYEKEMQVKQDCVLHIVFFDSQNSHIERVSYKLLFVENWILCQHILCICVCWD